MICPVMPASLNFSKKGREKEKVTHKLYKQQEIVMKGRKMYCHATSKKNMYFIRVILCI